MNMGPDIEWGAGVGGLTVGGLVDRGGEVGEELSIFCEFKNHVRARRTSTRRPPARTATSQMAAKVSTPGPSAPARTHARPSD